MPATKSDAETIRRLNRSLVLERIRTLGEISRYQLAKETRLSPTTVSAITGDLLRQGIIHEKRIGSSSGGRRPVLYAVDPEGRFVVSGRIGVAGSTFALVNPYGLIRNRIEGGEPVRGRKAISRAVREGIGRILEESRVPRRKVIGCALSFPGIIDQESGRLLLSVPLGLSDFDARSLVQPLLSVRPALYKDTDALLLGEFLQGSAKDLRDVMYIWVGSGVGMSYVHEGRLVVLPRGGFELGHISINHEGPTCRCGSTGCLGNSISAGPVLARYGLGASAVQGLDYAGLCSRAGKGDARALAALEEAADSLAIAVASVVNLFNPQLVLIGGPLHESPPSVQERTRERALPRILAPFRRTVRIGFSGLSPDVSLSAMAAEVFQRRLFAPDDSHEGA